MVSQQEKRAAEAAAKEERDAFMRRIRAYAEEIECSFEGDALECVEQLAYEKQQNGEELTEQLAVDMMEAAADAAEARHKLFEKKYDRDGCLILRRMHFEGKDR